MLALPMRFFLRLSCALLLAGCGQVSSPVDSGEAFGHDAGPTASTDAGYVYPPFSWPQADAGSPCTPTANAGLLSQVCLYDDIAARRLRPDVVEFTPTHPLWSDRAEKRRWVRLPAGTTVDTSEMDSWKFPVGAAFFKEFMLGDTLLETRMIRRTGPGAADYEMIAFVWNADGLDATAASARVSNVNGTNHDVPSRAQCKECHEGEAGRVLGFSALQLSGPGEGPRLFHLKKAGLLSNPPAADHGFPVPGNETEAFALGYLHSNCGPCHNPDGSAYWLVQMDLRVPVMDATPEQTPTYLTTIGKRAQASFGTISRTRVTQANLNESDLYLRMGNRGSISQMPPFVSEQVDQVARARIADWINGL